MANPKDFSKIEAQTAKDIGKKRTSKRVSGARGSATQRNLRKDGTTRRRKPVPVPKNKSLEEIKEMDPDDPQFKHPEGGGPRKPHTMEEDTTKLSYRDVVRREKQRSANGVRARSRKAEAVTAKAIEVHKEGMRVHKNEGVPVEDEDVLISEGILDLEDWDAQELARGYRRNRNGRFGPPPKYIAREIQQEAFKRLVKHGERAMKEAYLEIVKEQINLALHSESDKVKLDAQVKIQERLIGKVPDTVRIGAENPWQEMLADSLEVIEEPVVLDMEFNDGVATMLPGEESISDDG